MELDNEPLENPIMGCIVIAAALIVGLLSATVFGQTASSSPDTATATIESHGDAPQAGAPSLMKRSPTEARWSPSLQSPSFLRSRVAAKAVPVPDDDAPPSRHWILGVRWQATAIGCRITEVIEHSAADHVGLRSGDTILTVNGSQVGWVGREFRPLHRAIDSAPQRAARLLIRRGDRGCLEVLVVPLQSFAETLRQ